MAESDLKKRRIHDRPMVVPTIFKDTGGMSADTLDTPLFRTLTTVLLDEFPRDVFGPSLELFSHKTVRTDVSNMFDPTGTAAGIAPKSDGSCFYHPFMRNADATHAASHGYVDFRDAIHHVFPHCDSVDGRPFGVTLIDPPYTPMEQKKLYSTANTVTLTPDIAADLLLTSQSDIDELYRVSIEWAIMRTREVIVIYGYKNLRLPNWDRCAILMSGAGSGHPTVWAVVYVREGRDAIQTDQLVSKIVASASKLNGVWHGKCHVISCDVGYKDFARSMVSERVVDGDDAFRQTRGNLHEVGPLLREQQQRGGGGCDIVATVYGKQDQYTQEKKRMGAYLAPPQHPSYLSGFQAALHSAMFAKSKLALVTRQWTLYQQVFKKIPAKRRRLFVVGEFDVKRYLFESRGWADTELVIIAERISLENPSL